MLILYPIQFSYFRVNRLKAEEHLVTPLMGSRNIPLPQGTIQNAVMSTVD
jgi:hypothetical protein